MKSFAVLFLGLTLTVGMIGCKKEEAKPAATPAADPAAAPAADGAAAAPAEEAAH
jgi:hypothetical protein